MAIENIVFSLFDGKSDPKGEKLSEHLNKLIMTAKDVILHELKQGTLSGRDLQSRVISVIDFKEKKNGEFEHDTQPIHMSAFIRAYKELELTSQIKITRPAGVPFPMTDYATMFALNHP